MDRAIRRQFAYNIWANRRVAASLRTIPGAIDVPLRLFSHVLNAERIWLSRFQGGPAVLPWNERTLDECDRLIEENGEAYSRFLAADVPADEPRVFEYRNLQGVPCRTDLRDILQHVLTHGCYHRGQVATAVKAAGGEPASTDFILYVRELGEG